MDENNQILDVTYGNFACRLEGFDDSVETMKTVVAFFHDLAGHERFMDMEPQAPDMATLALLTEEQTGVPVDVEGEGNKVSLRVRTEVVDDTPEMDALDEDASDALSDDVDDVPEETTEEFQSNVADKLQRLRDVTLRAAPAVADDFSEDLGDAADAIPAANPLSQRLSELANRSADSVEDAVADAEDEVVAEEDAAHDDDLNVFSDLSEKDAALDAIEEESEEPVSEIAEDAELAADEAFEAEEIATEEEDVDAIAEEEIVAEQDEAVAGDDATDVDVEGSAEDLDEAVMEEQSASDDASEDDAEDADVATTDDPLVLASGDQTAEEAVETDDYNDDDEFDLEAEVAKVEAELAAREGNEFARHGLPRHVEDAMSRIMSQTDQHLNQPENRRHRDAFAQLKAAVAATEAARQLGDPGADKRDPDEVYKDDLGAHEEANEEPKASTPEPAPAPTTSPAPLKLVKSQEVKPAPAHLEPTPTNNTTEGAAERLRQIATKIDAGPTEDTGGFVEFAASHGATDLVDQMEAAGAYICFVEGEDDFSRPQVMKVVQSASSAEISREDGLRSFGRLLRQARLVKQANGRFQVADDTQYRPDGNKAAQG